MLEEKNPLLGVIRTILAILGVVATVFSCVIAFLALVNPEQTKVIITSFSSPSTPTPMVIVATVPAPTPLPTYTPYLTYTPYPSSPTAPPYPTYTPYPKPTLSPTPKPILVSLPFEDDFDMGPRPEWEIVQGKWGTAKGQFTLIDISERPAIGIALVGDTSWDNYAVEFDVTGLWDKFYDDYYHKYKDVSPEDYDNEKMNRNKPPIVGVTYYSRAAILVGVDKEGDGAGLIVGASYMVWGTFEEGLWNVASGTLVQAYGEEGAHLRITVRGNVYKVYDEKGKMLTSFSVPGCKGGKVGVWLSAYNELPATDWRAIPKIDNFSVTPLD